MSNPIDTTDRPPSYEETAGAGPTTSLADDVIQPTILILAGQTIHAETASSAPLYYLDRAIALLTRISSKVTLERVERAVRTGPDNEPMLRDRRRHIYTLERSWTIYNSLPSSCPRFLARSVSKQALGHFGLKKARLRPGFKVLPLDITGKKFGIPAFLDDAQPLFEIRKKDGRWEWTDKDGNAVAVEDECDDTHRLIVTAPLPRATLDALVALWCCQLWEYSAAHTEDLPEGMEGIRRKLRLGKGFGASGLGGWVT